MTTNPEHTPINLAGAVRELRRRADLSQRQLAARSGVPPATVGAVECGESRNPGFRTVERLVAAAGARVAIVDADGSEPVQPQTRAPRDAAHRQLPAHLDSHFVEWQGARRIGRFGYLRNRRRRDAHRRERTGDGEQALTFVVRRLGPGDSAALRALRADAAELDLAGRSAPDGPPLTDQEALRYLRNPSIHHWIAEEQLIISLVPGRVIGHLVAVVHQRHTGPPAMVVTQLGILAVHRTGEVGRLLVAALRQDAARLAVPEIEALPDRPEVARQLRRLGFRSGFWSRSRRVPRLVLP